MKNLRIILTALAFIATASLSGNVFAATAEDLNKDSNQALAMLTKANPLAAEVAKKSEGSSYFPEHCESWAHLRRSVW